MSMKQRGKNKFKDIWLSKVEYKPWLEKKTDHVARCNLCMKDISVDNMGEAAITSHRTSAKHVKLLKEHNEAKNSLSLLHFLPAKPISSIDSVSTSQSTKFNELAVPLSVVSAEIRWALKSVLSHFSMRSCLDVNSLFKAMFPDSEIARKFQMSKTKIGYFITFGIAPYFKQILLEEIKKSPFYSVLFDESLNRIFQEEQMDVQVRYWNDDTGSLLRYVL